MSSHTSEFSITQFDWTRIGCPYSAIVVEYLAKVVSFFLLAKTTAHSKKCHPPSMPPCKRMCHGVNLSYAAKQNEKKVISIK
jgi:hypothetical protein